MRSTYFFSFDASKTNDPEQNGFVISMNFFGANSILLKRVFLKKGWLENLEPVCCTKRQRLPWILCFVCGSKNPGNSWTRSSSSLEKAYINTMGASLQRRNCYQNIVLAITWIRCANNLLFVLRIALLLFLYADHF